MGPADLGHGLLPILLSIRMPVGRMPDTDSRKNRLSQSHHLRNLSWPIFCLNLIYKKREKAIRCMPGKENLSRYQRLRCKLFAISTKHCKLIFTSFLWRATGECVLERDYQQQGTTLLLLLTRGHTCTSQSRDSSSAASHNRSSICCSSAHGAALRTRKSSALAFRKD